MLNTMLIQRKLQKQYVFLYHPQLEKYPFMSSEQETCNTSTLGRVLPYATDGSLRKRATRLQSPPFGACSLDPEEKLGA